MGENGVVMRSATRPEVRSRVLMHDDRRWSGSVMGGALWWEA